MMNIEKTIEALRSNRMDVYHVRTAEEAKALAREYEFSGGQIENIARKYTIAQILSESDITLNDIRSLCSEELLEKRVTARRIGF